MKTFFVKIVLYLFLILLALELIVRVFHLYTEDPPRFIDELGVEKRIPRNSGYAVYGNRNQRFSKFDINNAGFNAHRDFLPSDSKFEVALIGDSFIEGFHQDVHESICSKIEKKIPGIEAYQYGYAGYDMANQLHLINAYKNDFSKIDAIVLYMKFENDLLRGTYSPNYERIEMLRSPLFRIRDEIKLLAYGSKIGILETLKRLVTGKAFEQGPNGYQTNEIREKNPGEQLKKELQYLNNFKSLIHLYGFDKKKMVLLLDKRETSATFLDFCDKNNIKYIDFSTAFAKSTKHTTLIYDWHWNNHGRELIAQVISDYLRSTYPELQPDR